MDTHFIAIVIALGLLGLGVLALAVFSVRNLTYGKHSFVSLLVGGIPVLLLIILGFTGMTWSQAAVTTAVIAFVLATGALFLSAMRSAIGF